jgi:hypothetical protein
MALHFMILYVPFFTRLFAITSLTWAEWQGVLWISLPVLIIDEILKFISRRWIQPATTVVEIEKRDNGKPTAAKAVVTSRSSSRSSPRKKKTV